MEIHPPNGSIHSFKEFLIHLSMVVLGILIALGIEQVREHFHEQHLVQDARANFHAEINEQRESLKEHLAIWDKDRDLLSKVLLADNDRSRPAPDLRTLALQWQFLETGGWDAAAATQAFSYMNYSEVQLYSQIYASQKIFNDFEEKAHAEIIVLSPMLDAKSPTVDQKKLRDRDIQVLLGYSRSIDQIGRELLITFDKVPATQ